MVDKANNQVAKDPEVVSNVSQRAKQISNVHYNEMVNRPSAEIETKMKDKKPLYNENAEASQ